MTKLDFVFSFKFNSIPFHSTKQSDQANFLMSFSPLDNSKKFIQFDGTAMMFFAIHATHKFCERENSKQKTCSMRFSVKKTSATAASGLKLIKFSKTIARNMLDF